MIRPLTPPEVTPQVIAVKVPHNKEMFHIYEGSLRYLDEDVSGSDGGPIFKTIVLPPGQWEILGSYGAVTEEMAKRIVEKVPYAETKGISNWYPDYGTPKIEINGGFYWSVTIGNALESLTTLMNSKKLYLVNPYGKPDRFIYNSIGDRDYPDYSRAMDKWQEAEDRKSDYVFLTKK
jgi:hypothetical protein